VLQRARLLDRVMADVYGPQQLLALNLLPPALVQAIRATCARCMGCGLPEGRICTSPRSTWRAIRPALVGGFAAHPGAVRPGLPAGKPAGDLAAFSRGLRDLHVQRLAATYRALLEGLRAMCPAEGEPRIVLPLRGPTTKPISSMPTWRATWA